MITQTLFTYQTLGKGVSREPKITVSSLGVLFLMWRTENIRGTPTSSTMMLARSTNGGMTFAPFQNLSGYGIAREPKITTSGPNVYVSWRFLTAPANDFQIYTANSRNNGTTFSSPLDVSGPTGITYLATEQNGVAISSSGPVLQLAWNANLSGTNQLFIARSTDLGRSFTNYLVDSGTSIKGQLASTWGDDFYYVWNLNSGIRYGVCG